MGMLHSFRVVFRCCVYISHLIRDRSTLVNMSSIEDMILIQNLTARYALAMDEGRFDDWLEFWCKDEPCFENPAGQFIGKEGFERLLPILRERTVGKRHFMTNSAISVDGNNATQTCYMLITARSTTPSVLATAVYRDILVKVDGDWKFKKRAIEFDS